MTTPVVHGDLTPLYMQPAASDPQICYGAADFRLLVASVFPSPGVLSLSDWTIAAVGSAILNVGIGTGIVAGTSASEQRSYICRNATAKTIQPPGPPASANRYDLICLTAHDGQITGDHLYEWQVQCLSGAESATPSVPTLPNDSIPLAAILRKPAAVNMAAADLTDLRKVALLPTQPQSQKYWRVNSAATSPAFTTTEVKDSSFPNLTLVVTNANAVYRIVCVSNVQSGHALNQNSIFIRDGGTVAPIITSAMVASAAGAGGLAGSAGSETLVAMIERTFTVGTHILGVFGKVTAGTSIATYLVVPYGGAKYLSAEIVG
jgi:hypothetical protein